ncbi:hypothetical protein H5410_039798 [Solanum commersonii]|uniref:Uncharacterized protein n=1 Tax=Solanum commersonii TaxID=4109 RepID=A0A9J5XPJ5_SOLCO|nr:hypothetical protein H5410_039798 [Solanum commersonii]
MEEIKIIATVTSITILFLFTINIDVSNIVAGLPNEKIVVITNNHTNYLSVRCFSFDEDGDINHLNTMGNFNITVKIRKFISTSTMFNCSTTHGTLWHLKPAMSVLVIQCLVNGGLMRTSCIATVPRRKSGLLVSTIQIMSFSLEEESSKYIMLVKWNDKYLRFTKDSDM